MRIIAISILLCSAFTIKAQRFTTPFEAKRGFFTSVGYGYRIPGGDMKDRFGGNSTIGFDADFKYENNWTLGIGYHWMFGRNVNDRDMFDNLIGREGQIIDQDGMFSVIRFNQRGHMLDAHGGKIFPIGKNRNSGIVVTAGIGMIWHRIDIQASTAKVPQITGDYEKGYDRLTGGFALNQFVGYQFLDPKKQVNFRIGFCATQAFTKSMRSYDFDIMGYREGNRTDMLSGFKAGLIIPIYTKDPDEEQYFTD